MAKQDSFDLPASKADELNDMVAAMIEQLKEVEDHWSEVADTARKYGPDDPRYGPLLKDWANVVSIICIVNDTLATIDQYTFPNLRPRYTNKNLTYPPHGSDYASTDGWTEDEFGKSEDESIHIRTNHLTTGTQQCQACGKPGTWHRPRDCPALSRCCCCCGRKGHLGKACSANPHPDNPMIDLYGTADTATLQFDYKTSDEDSSKENRKPTATNIASTTGSTDSSQFQYPESHESQDSTKNWTR